jgi:phenylpyruvate tautomerase PptA (4-oxalocrotonate tautomerase family)
MIACDPGILQALFARPAHAYDVFSFIHPMEDFTMPMVYIWTHEGKSAARLEAISQGVHAAMVDVLKVSEDTYDHFINTLPHGRMVYDRNYFGVARSDDMVFIHFFFNTRPPALKARFLEAVAAELGTRAQLDRADLMMAITEVAPENWWAYGREVDPATGYDKRMQVDRDGNVRAPDNPGAG